MPHAACPAIEKLVAQAGALFSLPSVAIEVLRLTESDRVDTKQLKEAIQRDPALSAKLLRVVNSSLFGLSGQVADLNQALALLGVQPLKMLVLGFSLPDALFARLAREPLRRFWTVSLTRAVSARSLAQRFPGVTGDSAFLAGLLRDLGTLVMVQQLGEPYLRFLELAGDSPEQLSRLERRALGFERSQLSAALLRAWRLPEELAAAVEFAADEPFSNQHDNLKTVVMLAERLSQLVLDHRLDALPELLELGANACGLTKQQLHETLAALQHQVEPLAAAMAVELSDDANVHELIAQAHQQLAFAAERAVTAELSAITDDQVAERLLAESHEVRLAMRAFLRDDLRRTESILRGDAAAAARPRTAPPRQAVTISETARTRLLTAVERLADRCRVARVELSLILLHATTPRQADPEQVEREIKRALAAAKAALQTDHAARFALDNEHLAVLMPGVDRRDAVAFSNACVGQAAQGELVRFRAGVATIAQVPNRFDPARLVHGALGCLSGARVSGSTPVKSIEVY